MTAPKSHRETESTLQGKTNMSSKPVTPGEQGNGDVPEQFLTREDFREGAQRGEEIGGSSPKDY